MIFPTTVNGIPCQCAVLNYTTGSPARIHGPVELCHPEEPAEFEFEILDRRGRHAPWLERYVTDEVVDRLAEEAHVMYQGEAAQAFDD